MEKITSRKNKYISYLRELGKDNLLRRNKGEYVCDGAKLLREAIDASAQINSVLFTSSTEMDIPDGAKIYEASKELVSYASPLENSSGPVFTVSIAENSQSEIDSAVILENIQDPGNVGTVIRTAKAFGIGAVILIDNCSDPYSIKAVRATMGAIFKQRIIETTLDALPKLLADNNLRLLSAALDKQAENIITADLSKSAIAIGNEGHGLSDTLIKMSDKKVIIPMAPGNDSLNAAVAASIFMWEYSKMRKAGD